MGWEHGRYYTRSKKANGRVVREYFGSGIAGKLAAEHDEHEREKRRAETNDRRTAIADLDKLAEDLDALSDRCDLLAQAAIIAAGYHQHHGEWRKQRVRRT